MIAMAEIDVTVIRDFIHQKGLDDELVAYARKVAKLRDAGAEAIRLGFVTRQDLASLATGMPYLHESTKADVIDWLIDHRPDVLAERYTCDESPYQPGEGLRHRVQMGRCVYCDATTSEILYGVEQ